LETKFEVRLILPTKTYQQKILKGVSLLNRSLKNLRSKIRNKLVATQTSKSHLRNRTAAFSN